MKYVDKRVCVSVEKIICCMYILLHDSSTEMLNLCKFKAMYSTDMSYVNSLTKKDE
jgi:hypothetical protein